jgi:Tfp pilus assembly protein PilV
VTLRGKSKGSALIEVMVALVIFVLVTLGITSSTINATRTADGSRHAAEATTLALDRLEHLRTLSSSAADLTSGTHSDPANPLSASGAGGGIFTRTWTVTTSLPSLSPAVASGTVGRVDMQVSWPTKGGAGSVTLVGYFKLS